MINQLDKRDRDEPSLIHNNHCPRATLAEVVYRPVTEIPRVFHVIGMGFAALNSYPIFLSTMVTLIPMDSRVFFTKFFITLPS